MTEQELREIELDPGAQGSKTVLALIAEVRRLTNDADLSARLADHWHQEFDEAQAKIWKAEGLVDEWRELLAAAVSEDVRLTTERCADQLNEALTLKPQALAELDHNDALGG